jgi:hypothetical protein
MGYMVFFITTVIYQNQVFYFIFLKITGIKTKTHPDIQWGWVWFLIIGQQPVFCGLISVESPVKLFANFWKLSQLWLYIRTGSLILLRTTVMKYKNRPRSHHWVYYPF